MLYLPKCALKPLPTAWQLASMHNIAELSACSCASIFPARVESIESGTLLASLLQQLQLSVDFLANLSA
jgi:hypothetical protein